jgi:hypothetical protein
MIRLDYIAQPSPRPTIEAVAAMLGSAGLESLDVAAAYATSGGVEQLLKRAASASGGSWPSIGKQWLTSFDYCRTEPVALDALLQVPSSQVRIYDAQFCLSNGGTPRVPFHPKAFLIRSSARDFALTGSGNLSRSGLTKGVEAGLVLEASRTGAVEFTAAAAIVAMRQWFAALWNSSSPLNATLLSKYERLFESAKNLAAPTPTEDDLASNDLGKGTLTSSDLMKLRVCRSFWIEAGNITRNRGPHLPGNQLMMKRLSRVFFGFEPFPVSENTLIGSVSMRFNTGGAHDYSLTYSDNKMDKLNLPMPGSDGPAEYDNKNLLFYRATPELFKLSLGRGTDKALWLKKSKAIGAAFKMSSGREWGVF